MEIKKSLKKCLNKVRYDNLEHARSGVISARMKFGKELFPYLCDCCSLYHLTSSDAGPDVIPKSNEQLLIEEIRREDKKNRQKIAELEEKIKELERELHGMGKGCH